MSRPRVALTPGSIAGVVEARKRHRCDSHLASERHYIEPGQRYVANALPPHHPEVGNTGWWHSRMCLDCCPAEHDPRINAAGQGVGVGDDWQSDPESLAAAWDGIADNPVIPPDDRVAAAREAEKIRATTKGDEDVQ